MSALWERGGRTLVAAVVGAALGFAVLAVPIVAGAGGGKPAPRAGAFVSPGLLEQARLHPGEKIHVIIQSSAGTPAAETAFRGGVGWLRKRLDVVGAVAVEIPAGRLNALARIPGLTITPDAPVHFAGSLYAKQLWPYESGNGRLWRTDPLYAATMPAVAIVDSGIDASRADFAGKIVANVDLSTLTGNSPGDGRGHGTFVAGIAAGAAAPYVGASPLAKIVAIDVMDDRGMARTSDVIAAAEWILRHKAEYGIRVANFSLHSSTPSSFTWDPLDKAVEKLWFSGVVVIAAAGNYGTVGGPSGVRYAPGNDPFVITVGAIDLGGTPSVIDDVPAPFTAYGYTNDGFLKPDLSAVGRYMVGPVPPGSTLATEKAENLVSAGYIQLSGTSFAAPVVAGTVTQMLARHPQWTPDQVKGALMATARKLPKDSVRAGGVGKLTASRAAKYPLTPPNPNLALNRFVVPDPSGGPVPVFDAVSWSDAARADVSWDSVSWSDVSWSDVSWDSVSWSDVSWSDVSWSDVSWSDVSWSDVSWTDVSWEDAAEGDALAGGGYGLDEAVKAELEADPDVGVPAAEIGEPVAP